MTKFAKVGSEFSQILNKPCKYCHRLLRFCQSGIMSPNLVTLDTLYLIRLTTELLIITIFIYCRRKQNKN